MRHTRHVSLASIFYVTTLTAVFFALLSPWLGAIRGIERDRLIKVGVIQWVFFGAIVAGQIYWRRTIAKRAGKMLFRTSFRVDCGFDLRLILRHFGSLLLVIPAEVLMIVIFTKSPWAMVNPGFYWMHAIILTRVSRVLLSVLLGVDSSDVELFENGYAHGVFNYLPWNHLESVRPADHREDTIVVVTCMRKREDGLPYRATQTIRVWPSRRDEICEVMSERINRTTELKK